MKKLIYLISLFVFISCVQELNTTVESDEVIIDKSDIKSVTLKVRISDKADTRISYSDDTGQNGSNVSIKWTDYDYINVKVGDNSYEFAFKGYEDDETSAVFKCSADFPELTKGMKLTAEYPSKGMPDLSEQYGTLQSLSLYHYMTAEYTVSDDDTSWEDVVLSFKTQTPLMKFTLRNDAFKGKIVKNLYLYIGNRIIVSSTSTFKASEDAGEFVAYFAIDPQTINSNANIIAVCNNITYEAPINASAVLEGGKLYRINKTMRVADILMTYEEGKAFINVLNEVTDAALIDKLSEAIDAGYVDFVLKGTLTDSNKSSVNELLTDLSFNTVLTIDNISTYYVYDDEGFMNWGSAAQNDRKANCTLINDIVLKQNWEYVIGTPSTYYSGVFEGNGHFIDGLVINQDAEPIQYYHPVAMISYFAGEIRNVVLKGGKCVNLNDDNLIRCALLIGFNQGLVEDITIGYSDEYVFFNIESSTSVYIGTIVCQNSGIVKDCKNDLSIKIFVPENTMLTAGGIVGSNNELILQSINKGDIIIIGGSTKYIGGVVGHCNGNKWGAGNLYLCANTGRIDEDGDGKGGLIGISYYVNSVFAGCYTTKGDVIGDRVNYNGTLDHSYTCDYYLNEKWYIFHADYVSSLNNYCDEMNEAVEKYGCEYVDKEWVPGDGLCPDLEINSL